MMSGFSSKLDGDTPKLQFGEYNAGKLSEL